jgi:dinuclear metal center YbgI/SA1388 family protein
MVRVSLDTITKHCDRLLRTTSFNDWEGAANGLQVENRGTVTRLAAAVDASHATVRMAIEAGADLLLVHHGLFFGVTYPWTRATYRMQRMLIENNLAVYSSHLPLDAHPKLGNNAQLVSKLGWRESTPFLECRGRRIGQLVKTRVARDELAARLRLVFGSEPKVLPHGPETCRRIGIASGGGGSELTAAAKEGADTLVTGEGSHWTWVTAQQAGINVIYCGHYATETLGVKALGAHLARKFGLPWQFLDHPSGL